MSDVNAPNQVLPSVLPSTGGNTSLFESKGGSNKKRRSFKKKSSKRKSSGGRNTKSKKNRSNKNRSNKNKKR